MFGDPVLVLESQVPIVVIHVLDVRQILEFRGNFNLPSWQAKDVLLLSCSGRLIDQLILEDLAPFHVVVVILNDIDVDLRNLLPSAPKQGTLRQLVHWFLLPSTEEPSLRPTELDLASLNRSCVGLSREHPPMSHRLPRFGSLIFWLLILSLLPIELEVSQ